ncbi:AAA family ATPase [Mycolicibacterium goodii]|uniref:AAA family ATPase n=1 Tax=Mycolicibacterium goodii TaxID=134601 RepID=UPI000C25A16F|nr:AAA family ATPase [Mycolicibacterium goodii]PJK24407.1 hypothetical protein CSX11_00645 [Mycolicibacterium goodii]
MSIPNEPRKRLRRNESESAQSELCGLTADEFNAAATALIANGLHPVAIGKANPNKPDKAAGKAPWHQGVTGYEGVNADADQVIGWPSNVAGRIERGERGLLNLGMRMPVGGIGLDVDAYDGKRGLETVAEHGARLGSLPPTYRITARPYEQGSGIRLYRVPDDWHGATILKADDGGDGHVELIQRHHRLAAVPPSLHHTGQHYRIYGEATGQELPGGVVPRLEEWPKLPDAWLEGLRRAPAKAGGEPTDEQVQRFAAQHTRSEQPWHLTQYVVPPVRNADGSTRNAARDALYEAARTARIGWCSWTDAVDRIEQAARDRYAERGETFDPSDFARSVSAAVCAADAESLPELEDRYAKRLADEEAKRRAEAGVDEWLAGIQGIDADPPIVGRFRLVSARELGQPIKPMRWLVRGIWPEQSAGVLGGDKKALKTWNLQAIALAVATGSALFDEYPATSQGPVLYLCGEGGQDTFANRHQVIAARYGLTDDTLLDVPLGAEFGVGMLTERKFTDAVKQHLDELQPKLVILDPLYAYHPSDVEVTNIYQRGPMLANLRTLVGGDAALIVGDHFNKTAGKGLDLDNIAQAGMAQWADSWILQKHRAAPDLENGNFQLELQTGSRRGGGKHLEVDWTLKRDASDPDAIVWTGVEWAARSAGGGRIDGPVDTTAQRILQVVKDYDFAMTESQVAKEAGGNRQKAFDTLNGLKVNGFLVVEKRERSEGGKKRARDLVGLGPRARGSSVPGLGTDEETGSRASEPVGTDE